jgi:lysophospholipase L1-like esterase
LALVCGLLVAGAPAVAQSPAPPNPATMRYVALGDSYTSGPLLLPHDQTWVPQDCGQALLNYPHLAATALGLSDFEDRSCGGAKIDDFTAPQDGLTLGSVAAPQFDALTADTRIVTLGIGGNDVGFTTVALDCVRLLGPPLEGPCTPLLNAGGVDSVAADIEAMGDELAVALQQIHERAPLADVYVVSYPAAIPDDGVGCWPYMPILDEDIPYLLAKFKQMNAELAEQAAANDATYVDIYTPSIGHDVCQLPGIAWVNGAVVVPPSYPAHPNQLGMLNAGQVVAAAIRDGSLRAAAVDDTSEGDGDDGAAASSRSPTLPATGGGSPTALGIGLAALAAAMAMRALHRPPT